MYRYDTVDRTLVASGSLIQDQTRRFLDGEMSDASSTPATAQRLYIQTMRDAASAIRTSAVLAPAANVASIARRYDGLRAFHHAPELQYNGAPGAVPDILAELAEVEMHAIQTSGNCIRNTFGHLRCRRR